jgi:hypothetical protein
MTRRLFEALNGRRYRFASKDFHVVADVESTILDGHWQKSHYKCITLAARAELL